MSHVSSSLASLSAEGSNVLLLAGDPPATDDACRTLLGGPDPGESDVLGVAFRRDPDDCLRAWRLGAEEDRAGAIRIVDVGTTTRSAGVATPGVHRAGPGPRVTTVQDPGDLTGIGIHLVEVLAEWAAHGRRKGAAHGRRKRAAHGRRNGASDGHQGRASDGRIAVCFHSVSDLLQHVGVERAFRFLHVLLVRLGSVDARAHFHLDPARHDDRTVAILSGLFDAVVEVGEDEVAVRRR